MFKRVLTAFMGTRHERDRKKIQPILDALRAKRLTIRAVRPVRESLEDLFMKAVTDPGTGRTLDVGASDGPDNNSPKEARP